MAIRVKENRFINKLVIRHHQKELPLLWRGLGRGISLWRGLGRGTKIGAAIWLPRLI